MKKSNDVTKNLLKHNEEEGYDDPEKKPEEPPINSVCILSLTFVFIAIGVLVSLAVWSYIVKMSSAGDARKPDRTKLHSHKHNSSLHKQYVNGTDFISKMEIGTILDERTDDIKKWVSSKFALRDYNTRRHNITRPQMEPITEKGDINFDVMNGFTVGSLMKRINALSPKEIRIIKERQKHHRHEKSYLHNITSV